MGLGAGLNIPALPALMFTAGRGWAIGFIAGLNIPGVRLAAGRGWAIGFIAGLNIPVVRLAAGRGWAIGFLAGLNIPGVRLAAGRGWAIGFLAGLKTPAGAGALGEKYTRVLGTICLPPLTLTTLKPGRLLDGLRFSGRTCCGCPLMVTEIIDLLGAAGDPTGDRMGDPNGDLIGDPGGEPAGAGVGG